MVFRSDNLRLMRDGVLLARMTVTGSDMPSIICSFEPTNEFEELRYLFEAEVEVLYSVRVDNDYWKEQDSGIRSLKLRIVNEDTDEDVGFLYLHIRGHESWYIPRIGGIHEH